MSIQDMTVPQLRADACRYIATKAIAKAALVKAQDALGVLISENATDAERLRAARKLAKLTAGDNTAFLGCMSLIAHETPDGPLAQLRALYRRKSVRYIARQAREKVIRATRVETFLMKGTGVSRPLAKKILALGWRVVNDPSVGIKDGMVFGPKGSMPLQGPLNPMWLENSDWSERRMKKKAKKS